MKQKKKTIQPKRKSNSLSKLATLGMVILLTGTGAGIGVGYAIWHRIESKIPGITCETSVEQTAFLEDAGNVCDFKFKLNDPMSKWTTVLMEIEESYSSILATDGSGLIIYSDKDGNQIDTSNYGNGSIEFSFPPGVTEEDVYITRTENENNLPKALTVIPFEFSAWYGGDSPTTGGHSITNINIPCFLYLHKKTNTHEDPNSIQNMYIPFEEAFYKQNEEDEITWQDVVSYIPNAFPNLPKIDVVANRIDLTGKNWAQVIHILQTWDNAESFACLFLVDYVMEMFQLNQKRPEGQLLRFKKYKLITLNFFDVDLHSGLINGTDRSTFNIQFEATGYSSTLGLLELAQTVFTAVDQNFSSPTPFWDLWWDEIYQQASGRQYLDQNGTATGLSLAYTSKYMDQTDPLAMLERTFIKSIYGNVVGTWPDWWTTCTAG